MEVGGKYGSDVFTLFQASTSTHSHHPRHSCRSRSHAHAHTPTPTRPHAHTPMPTRPQRACGVARMCFPSSRWRHASTKKSWFFTAVGPPHIYREAHRARRRHPFPCVTHGRRCSGLCRSGTATIDQMKAIDRQRPVPVSTNDPKDVLFFDTMWAGKTLTLTHSLHSQPTDLDPTFPPP